MPRGIGSSRLLARSQPLHEAEALAEMSQKQARSWAMPISSRRLCGIVLWSSL